MKETNNKDKNQFGGDKVLEEMITRLETAPHLQQLKKMLRADSNWTWIKDLEYKK